MNFIKSNNLSLKYQKFTQSLHYELKVGYPARIFVCILQIFRKIKGAR